jgi:pimeloyl-ACP methyl ester carboxylesterase
VEGGSVSAVRHGSGSDRYVIACHGFGSDKSGSYKALCNVLAKAGLNAVRFDFRGNGNSSMSFEQATVSTRLKDLESVVSYFEPESYGVYGSSFGGRIAAFHQSCELSPKFLILRAPALLDRVMNAYLTRFEREGEFEFVEGKKVSEEFVQDYGRRKFSDTEIDVPSLVFQGNNDRYVPPEQTRSALSSFKNHVRYVEYPEEGHRFSDRAKKKIFDEASVFAQRWL